MSAAQPHRIMPPSTLLVRLGEEKIPPDEPVQIDRLVAIERSIQELKDRQHFPVRRNVHPKQHGCVCAELVVDPCLADELRHGLFVEARSYPAVVRFSNARQQNDQLPDGHGMAVKVFDVPGQKLLAGQASASTHDFLFVDHPVFFARDVADMIPMMQHFRRLMTGGVLVKAQTVFTAVASRDHRFRIVRQMASKRPHSPLEIQYWSTTPFKFGDGAAKFSVRPQLDCLSAEVTKSQDQLRLAMAATLRERDVNFDLLVQLQTDPATMPIEDATAKWPEAESPFQKVATLHIPQQNFEAPRQLVFGEGLSFNPWHATPDHRPLGGINRARREIYTALSARRHELSGIAEREPTLGDMLAAFSR